MADDKLLSSSAPGYGGVGSEQAANALPEGASYQKEGFSITVEPPKEDEGFIPNKLGTLNGGCCGGHEEARKLISIAPHRCADVFCRRVRALFAQYHGCHSVSAHGASNAVACVISADSRARVQSWAVGEAGWGGVALMLTGESEENMSPPPHVM